MKTIHYCKSEDCNNIVDYRTYKYGKGYCKSCTIKGIGHEADCQCCICKTKRNEYLGKINPNYKHGFGYGRNCIDCGKKISFHAIRCTSCAKNGNQLAKGYHHTQKTKNNPMYGVCRSGKDGTFYGMHHTEGSKRLLSLGHGGTGVPYENTKYGFKWTLELKEQIRERDNHICQLCGKKQGKRKLSVHHIDYNKKNCKKENLICLCHSCHSKTNGHRNFWETVLTKC